MTPLELMARLLLFVTQSSGSTILNAQFMNECSLIVHVQKIFILPPQKGLGFPGG